MIERAGGIRKAHSLLLAYKKTEYPTLSALQKSAKGTNQTTDYVMKCYIEDLEKALEQRGEDHDQ